MADDETPTPASKRGQESRKVPLVCTECGSPYGRHWHTADGVATLCPTCAQFFGLGCP